jgi:hypothetical protein
MDCFFFKQAVTKYEKMQVAKHWENVRKEMAAFKDSVERENENIYNENMTKSSREKNSRPEFFEPLPLHEA